MQVSTPEDLFRELAKLGISVPLRSQGRTKEDTERYSLAYLISSIPASRLPFPLSVTHGDRPDFVLSGPYLSIGVEHTEAVPQNVAQSDVIRESGVGPDVYFTPHATPGEPVKKGRMLRQEIERDEAGDGWVGDSPEREWAEAMLHFAIEKARKAMAPGFARHEKNWLLVYDNWPLPAVKHAVAAEYFGELLHFSNVFEAFDSIFVLDSVHLCEFRPPHLLHLVKVPGVEPA